MITPKLEKDNNVRDEIYRRVFSDRRWVQLWLTFLTGCPHQGQKPLYLKPIHYLVFYILCFVLGIFGNVWFLDCGWYLLIPLGWFLTLAGVAGFVLAVIHQASHFKITGDKKLDFWLGKIAAILVWMPRFELYFSGHRKHHLPKTHQTIEDNTILVLKTIGIEPGLGISQYWKGLLCLLDPVFIFKFAVKRTLGLFIGYWKEVWLAWLFWGLVGVLITLSGNWSKFAIAYLIPLFILYPSLYYLRHCVEHKMTSLEIYAKKNREYIALSTDAVFLGELPPYDDGILSWTGWWLRMLFWHGAIRLLICTADVPVHDYHTRMAGSLKEDWANAIWHRHQQQEAGNPGWGIPYNEVWGFINAMNVVFASFARLPKDWEF